MVDSANSDANPIPNKTPVNNRLALVLSYLVNAWAKPSRIRGNSIINEAITFGLQNQNMIILPTIPANSPIHLAHMGNLCPL